MLVQQLLFRCFNMYVIVPVQAMDLILISLQDSKLILHHVFKLEILNQRY